MNALYTGLRAFRMMLPVFAIYAALLAIAEQLTTSTALLGAQIIMGSILIYMAHTTILSGHFSLSGKKPDGSKSNSFPLSFLGRVFLVLWLPAFAGLALGIWVALNSLGVGTLALIGFPVLFMWLSLSWFGWKLPQFVYKEIAPEHTTQGKHDRSYVAIWLAVWNILYFAIMALMVVFFWYAFSLIPSVPEIAAEAISSFVFGTLHGVAVCVTAAVLSHAHVSANGLGDIGLVRNS